MSTTTSSRSDNGGGGGGTGNFNISPRSEWKLISQGAEARVWKLHLLQQQDDDDDDDNNNNSNSEPTTIICKERFSKAYRHPDLDAKLTKSRCRSEARILERCAQKSREYGPQDDDSPPLSYTPTHADLILRVPEVIRISPPSLYLEYLDGPNVKSYLQDAAAAVVDQDGDVTMKSTIIDYSKLAKNIGRTVGSLHSIGIVHGDLTTSNMILLMKDTKQQQPQKEKEYQLSIIDFGLAKSSLSVEEQAVDLYVLERALQSTHPELPSNFLDEVLEAYSTQVTDAYTSSK